MAQLPEMRGARREDGVGPHRYRGFGGGGSDETGDDLVGAELGLVALSRLATSPA